MMNQQAFLQLLQVFDSQFPVGAFAHSGGLETYAQAGIDKRGLSVLLEQQLRYGFGRLDAAACVLAFHADDAELAALAAELSAWKVVPGVKDTSLKLGKRLLVLARRLYPQVMVALQETHHALVVGVLAGRLKMDATMTLLAFLQSSVSAQLAAATRCMALSPEQAQEILLSLQPVLMAVAAEVLENPHENLFSATPALDVRAHQQAFLYSRLFQS